MSSARVLIPRGWEKCVLQLIPSARERSTRRHLHARSECLQRAACSSEQKEKNNEKISNSWNSFGSLGCIGICLFGHRYAEHEHPAGQTRCITYGVGKSGSITGRIARGGQEDRRE